MTNTNKLTTPEGAADFVRFMALRAANCRRLAKSHCGTLQTHKYMAMGRAYANAAKMVAVETGLCKASYA